VVKTFGIDGIRDGFGSQYLKKIGGFAFCEWEPNYKYVHIPLIKIDHVNTQAVKDLNIFIGIPDMRSGKKIDIIQKWRRDVFDNPDYFYTSCTMDKIRAYYWSSLKPKKCDHSIVVHIRRGDLGITAQGKRFIHPKRIVKNEHYARNIYKILKNNSSSRVKIHTSVLGFADNYSETGTNLKQCHKNYMSIFSKWPKDLLDRTTLSINENIVNTFHDMVTCDKLFMARSSLSYCAGLISTNEIFFQHGPSNSQTSKPLKTWNSWESYTA